MTVNALGSSINEAESTGSQPTDPPSHPNQSPLPTKGKNQIIHVSPTVLAAVRQDDEELLPNLRTSLNGLTESEAQERARTAGPNEVAQERKQDWPVRVLKILRNPLVILLTTLSGISFLPATRAPAL